MLGHVRRFDLRLVAVVALAGACVMVAPPAQADAGKLAPQTRVKLTVVHWMPAKGQYDRWDSLGGEFVVSADGTITTPVVGATSVEGLDEAGLADAIAKALQAKIGLNAEPYALVEVVEYPPVYVMGDVQTTGERQFRPGMTVLQALAVSGGEARAVDRDRTQAEIKLVGDLREIDDALIRGGATLSRLKAELAGEKEIRFDPVMNDRSDRPRDAEIASQERIIFAARANEIDRQARSFKELRELLGSEVKTLDQKVKDADSAIASAGAQLDGVKALVARGFATASRQTELERELAGYRTEKLDQLTAAMRARQGISEATRNLEGLQDQRRTEVASSIQREQATIDVLRLKRQTIEKLLVEQLGAGQFAGANRAPLAFAIVRRGAHDGRETTATETTPLAPGDVLKVRRGPALGPETKVSGIGANAPS